MESEKGTYRMSWKDWVITLYLTAAIVLMVFFAILDFNSMNNIPLVIIGIIFGLIFLILGFSVRMVGIDYVNSSEFVSAGIYSLIRHPIYLSSIFLCLGLMFISQNLFSAFLAITTSFLFYSAMFAEENECIEKFGDAYRDYMKLVPRMNLFIGIFRKFKQKK